ncbi:uncharacterized protein TRUGW13939_00961 [Talaromyces rugulosus]|uniref:Zn(2)-C6 fungal-type domain-containing protein n=1 Tax=Talaromyces rugulosus TaxID=121627 RepID=A0A7H8QJY7_TALRU|nr:uncharacterized protein TRUGW13939_00961 [Talaromyces rugulosus]QKX53881.1 hypothetical protein TRUGW13939_00961 [Talaromyces rugulosus]
MDKSLRRATKGRSKLGCLACRERHVKCDEGRPSCISCSRRSQTCVYNDLPPSKEWQRKVSTFAFKSSSTSRANTPSEGYSDHTATERGWQDTILVPTLPFIPTNASLRGSFSIKDTHLLNNFIALTTSNLIGSPRVWSHECIQLSFTNPFLMHAILMTGAAHLKILDPSQSAGNYTALSAHHSQKALRYFGKVIGNTPFVNNNLDAVIATTLLFAIHSCNSPTFDPTSEGVDGLLSHMNGIFDILRHVDGPPPGFLFESVCTPELLPSTPPTTGPASDLAIMVRNCAPEAMKTIYNATVESLTLVLDAVTRQPRLGNTSPHLLLVYCFRWLAFIPLEFTALLRSHDPTALVIIAYYYAALLAILSDLKGGWWWMRDRPVFFIQRISEFLGPEWEYWMSWPREILGKYNEVVVQPAVEPDFPVAEVDEMGLGILSEARPHRSRIIVNVQ